MELVSCPRASNPGNATVWDWQNAM